MKKIFWWIIGLAAAAALAVTAVGVAGWLAVRPRSTGVRYVTRVAVQEGSVYLYKQNADGTRRFLRFLKEGESAEVSGETHQLSSLFELIKPLTEKSVHIFLEQIDALAASEGTRPTFTRLYTQQEFNEHITRRLINARLVESMRLQIDRGGFDGRAEIGRGSLTVTVAGGGVLEADETGTGELKLRVYWAKVGPLPLPAFVLRQFERSFAELRAHEGYPLKILSMEYQDGGIVITCRRPSSAREPQ